MKKVTAVLFALMMISATLAFGSDLPATDLPTNDQVTQEQVEPTKEVVEAIDMPQATQLDPASNKECSVAEPGDDTKTWMGGFGPHCSSPFTCTIQEPGLGFGCTCTYRCDCAYCHGQLTPINCVLIDDGGCFACPM